MATLYVGPGGSDSNAGTSYANRFLTLGKAATTVSAGGDIVYVSPGTYRETLTVSVSGGNAYSTGTITVTNGSTTVTGSGTTFTGGNVVAGYYFRTAYGKSYLISAVNSATELILSEAWEGATAAGGTYKTYNPIKWIGDYAGTNTDGVGGLIRITGSGDDISNVRTTCITSTSKNYNHFTCFCVDLSTNHISLTDCTYWQFDKIYFGPSTATSSSPAFYATGNSHSNINLLNSYFAPTTSVTGGYKLQYNCSSNTDTQNYVANTIFQGGANETITCYITLSSGYFKNCYFQGGNYSVYGNNTNTAHKTYLYNSICNGTSIYHTSTSNVIVEDYNTLTGGAFRNNVAVGANSISYPFLSDPRWFFETTK